MVPIRALKGHSTPQNVGQDFAPLAKNDGSRSFQMKTFVNAIAVGNLVFTDMAKAVTMGNIQFKSNNLQLIYSNRPTPIETSLKQTRQNLPWTLKLGLIKKNNLRWIQMNLSDYEDRI
ncbi:uncharacterized protein LOC112164911 [Rosa chinensis]|uniref:uncharacterized protein LOC112164911 n=1 Tax=Rosa chinensis TaxID=74649 RepID=UPI001AD8ED40|nr:uncharacterized protein LOC112164911 [Rosa chinensis]